MKNYEEILLSMQQKYRALSGFEADDASDIGIRLKVLAQRVCDIYTELDTLRGQVFPQTSSERYLELHAETRGIFRKGALASTGMLRFSREVPAVSDIGISEGVICATRPEPQVQYSTSCAGILRAGEVSVDVPATAIDLGVQGNVAAGSVCLMVTPAPGISAVSSPAPFTGGVDEESDNMLRERLLQSYRNISNGTNCAFYYDLAMGKDGVDSVKVLPRNRGRGTVDVIVSSRVPAGETELVNTLQTEFALRKEINVDVRVKAAVRDVVGFRAEVSVKDGFDFDLVIANCNKAILAHIQELGVGNSLLLTKLGSALFTVEGIYNYRILAPTVDILPANDHIVEPGEISVIRMAVD